MAIDAAAFRIRFPEFADETEYPTARIDMFLDDAVDAYIGDDEARWGSRYNLAHAYLTAHLLSIASNSETGDTSSKAGVIQSKTAGGVSVSRAVNAARSRSEQDDFLASTSYGQQFISIRNMCFAGVLTANSL